MAVTIGSPSVQTTNVLVYQNDDYRAADSKALSWTDTTWPSITGATITLQLHGGIFTKTGSVVSATQARVELTNSDLASIEPGAYSYALTATLSNGHVVTLVLGSFVVVSRP